MTDQLTMFDQEDQIRPGRLSDLDKVTPIKDIDLSIWSPAQSTKPVSVKGCTLIYTPKGRAREYAALACNVYRGCDHQCVYCYAPNSTRRTGQVLLSFTCDPYQHLDVQEQVTRSAIKILHRHGLQVQMLTKGGSRALCDLDLFTPADAFASTLTLLDEAESHKWEPYAATPADRIETIRRFHEADIPTWISLEPVLDPAVALEIIRQTHLFVDLFKVGKLNYHPRARTIDWHRFANDAIELLKSLGKEFYIKKDLQRYI